MTDTPPADTPVEPADPTAAPAAEPAAENDPTVATADPQPAPSIQTPPPVELGDPGETSGATVDNPVEVPAGTDLVGPDAQMRAAVAEAGADLKPGQTITTTQAGEAVVTGTPAPDGLPEPSVTLKGHGAFTAIATPIGTVSVGFEIDPQGVARVVVTSYPASPDFNVLTDAVLIRQTSS